MLKLSAEKSNASVFTIWIKKTKFDEHLTASNSPLPMKCKVKLLGVTFDSMRDFREHVRSTKEKLQKSKMIMKKLLVATGAAQKRLSFVTYKSIGWRILNNGAAIGRQQSAIQTGTTCKRYKTLLFAQ